MNEEFGDNYAHMLVRDLVLEKLDAKSPQVALKDGVDPRKVWLAICDIQDVPQERWFGRDTDPKTRRK